MCEGQGESSVGLGYCSRDVDTLGCEGGSVYVGVGGWDVYLGEGGEQYLCWESDSDCIGADNIGVNLESEGYLSVAIHCFSCRCDGSS